MSLHILVLAAGEGRRFGGAVEQLANIRGKTMLENALDSAAIREAYPVSVVLGFQHEQLAPLVGKAQVVINSHWQDGIGASIACGVAALPTGASAVLIMLCDQVALNRYDLACLTHRYEQANNNAIAPIICASYAESLGVPAIFPQYFFKQLMALKGDMGAKQILHQNPVVSIPIANAAVDIDTHEQWTGYINSAG